MKILNLIIKDPQNKEIQNISFDEEGVSYVYGEIKKPKDPRATINSIGKTLLLKFLDYILGANEDSTLVKEPIHNYKLEAQVKYDNQVFEVKRTLGNSENIYIDKKIYTISEYREFFMIQRRFLDKQIILDKKADEISPRSKRSKDDVISVLELLKLKDMTPIIDSIYSGQDRIKDFKKNKKELVSFYGDFDEKQIDEEIYFVDKEVERLQLETEKVSEKIKSLKISEVQENIVEEYANKSAEFKKIKRQFENNKFENERLLNFIENSNKVDISSDHILAIYNKANKEVPEMVKKSIADVELFHMKVYEERKDFLNKKRDILAKENLKMEGRLNSLSIEIDRMGSIISVNEIYKQSIELYEKYNQDLHEVTYKQGKLSQVKNIDELISSEESDLTDEFNDAVTKRKEYNDIVETYRNFIYDTTKSIYDTDVSAFFDIKIVKRHLTKRPVDFEFTLKGDGGEGFKEVKKNLIDYLVCRYNNELEIMIQDSSCYNGIDPRQITGLLEQISEIAEITKKQIIISINKYQLGDDDKKIKEIRNKSSIILSEENKLLGFDY